MLATPSTSETIALDDLVRWLQNAPPASLEKGMLRLARAANEAARVQSARGSLERRRKQRTLVEKPLHAVAIAIRDEAVDGTIDGGLVPIMTRYISQGGIDFYSDVPLPHRSVSIELPTDDPSVHVVLVIELRWCRFSKEGVYVNGGVFTNIHFRNAAEVA